MHPSLLKLEGTRVVLCPVVPGWVFNMQTPNLHPQTSRLWAAGTGAWECAFVSRPQVIQEGHLHHPRDGTWGWQWHAPATSTGRWLHQSSPRGPSFPLAGKENRACPLIRGLPFKDVESASWLPVSSFSNINMPNVFNHFQECPPSLPTLHSVCGSWQTQQCGGHNPPSQPGSQCRPEDKNLPCTFHNTVSYLLNTAVTSCCSVSI